MAVRVQQEHPPLVVRKTTNRRAHLPSKVSPLRGLGWPGLGVETLEPCRDGRQWRPASGIDPDVSRHRDRPPLEQRGVNRTSLECDKRPRHALLNRIVDIVPSQSLANEIAAKTRCNIAANSLSGLTVASHSLANKVLCGALVRHVLYPGTRAGRRPPPCHVGHRDP